VDAFLYFHKPLPCGLDEIEDALDEVLRGIGEVTGTGTGATGSNLDIELSDDGLSRERLVSLIRKATARFELPPSSRLLIAGEEFSLG
jgi:hypothetical protein